MRKSSIPLLWQSRSGSMLPQCVQSPGFDPQYWNRKDVSKPTHCWEYSPFSRQLLCVGRHTCSCGVRNARTLQRLNINIRVFSLGTRNSQVSACLCLPDANSSAHTCVKHVTKWTISLVLWLLLSFKLFLQTGSHYAILAGLKLIV